MPMLINPANGIFLQPNVPPLSTQGSCHHVADITRNKPSTSLAIFANAEGVSARVLLAYAVLQSSVWIEKVACFCTMSSAESDAPSCTSCKFVGGIEAGKEKR